MATLSRRLADLEQQNPERFVIPEIGAHADTLTAAQALWILLMDPDNSDRVLAASKRFNAKEFATFAESPAAFRDFLGALSYDAMRHLKQLLEDPAPKEKEAP